MLGLRLSRDAATPPADPEATGPEGLALSNYATVGTMFREFGDALH